MLAASLLALAFGSCAIRALSTPPVVRIGLVAPFEGRHRAIGYDLIYAVRLAIRECNQRGGIEGYRVELVALDDGGSPELAVRAAQALVVDEMVMGAMGHWLEETTAAAMPAYAEGGMPLLAMGLASRQDDPPPADFVSRYQAVEPLGQAPGPYAVPAYVACNRLLEALESAIAANGKPTRAGLAAALASPADGPP